MTIDEFNNTQWHGGMFGIYNGVKYPIASCNFVEALIALDGECEGDDTPSWVRCENVDLYFIPL